MLVQASNVYGLSVAKNSDEHLNIVATFTCVKDGTGRVTHDDPERSMELIETCRQEYADVLNTRFAYS